MRCAYLLTEDVSQPSPSPGKKAELHWKFATVWSKKHSVIRKIFKAEILCAEDHHKIYLKTDAENEAHPQVRYEGTRKKNITLRT